MERTRVSEPLDVVSYLRRIWDRHTLELLEHSVVVYLNGSHQAIGWVRLSSGGVSSTIIDPRVVFGIALQTAASAIILGHNHPSGSLDVSPEDVATTKRLKGAGELLGIKLLDHVILTKESYVSLALAGYL